MILTFAEHSNGKIKKSTFECLTFARGMADQSGVSVGIVVFGTGVDSAKLGEYGADTVIQTGIDADMISDSKASSDVIAKIAQEKNAAAVIVSHSSFGKSVSGRLAVKLNAGLVSGVTQKPEGEQGGWIFTKSVYSGKADAQYKVISSVSVVGVMPNSIPIEVSNKAGTLEEMSFDVSFNVKIVGREELKGIVSLPEAELVVSAGRGMKGPENWEIVEELAKELGATTACSRPVADSDWRPHHEHVGQTGVAIRPNLYIAIGISGAIQHLAGVNNSKVIVVINKDPETPFFKAADYGVCADLFDVVPRLTEAIKKYKA